MSIGVHTITVNGVEHKIILPNDKPIRKPNFKIKAYKRGLRSYPRNDQQSYINNKYFMFINSFSDDTADFIIEVIQVLYSYGLELADIKQKLKIAFNQK